MNKTINELEAKTSPVDGDEVAIWDNAAGKTKKSTFGNIIQNLISNIFQKKDLTTTTEGATTVEGALGALSTNKAEKEYTDYTFTFGIDVEKQRTIRIPYENKQIGITIKAVAQSVRGSEFNGEIVGYGPMTDDRSLCVYSKEGSNTILISNITNEGYTTLITIGNPTNYGLQTIIVTLHNYEFSNITVESAIENTVTSMGSNWQKLVTSDDVSYSTSETLTGGTWIDGKPIYRKVFDTTSPSTGEQNADVADLPSNIDKLISMNGMLTSNDANGNTFQINNYLAANQYVSTWCHLVRRKIRMNVCTAYTNMSTRIIIEYTKTTD